MSPTRPLFLASLALVLSMSGSYHGNAGAPATVEGTVDASPVIAPPRASASRSRQVPGETTQLYWGDVHLHTNYSLDAYINGNTTMSPDQAYRFARGEEVMSQTGVRAKLLRPLDFLAVTDHSEYMGVHVRLAQKDPRLANWPVGKRWAELLAKGNRVNYLLDVLGTVQDNRPEDALPAGVNKSIWQDVVDAAERYYEPGRFTTLIGYEWSSTVSGDNLHRNVIFRGNGKALSKIVPFTNQDGRDPEQLWDWLGKFESSGGGKVLAIPHNANLSNGRMFSPNMSDGQPFTSDYVRTRARWEPLVEVTQIKGDGETDPKLTPDDEFADFERWDTTNLMNNKPKQPWMLQYEYARSVLGLGLEYESKLGANPFKFGMIGGTDAHTGLSGIEESNFMGKFPDSEPRAGRAMKRLSGLGPFNWTLSASGLTAAWARDNSRGAIFDAFARREVYATTGPRMKVRFFGGWKYNERDISRPDYVRVGYAKGVPMGGDLLRQKGNQPPRFMVVASKDPDGANLDRVQIIKGWLDANGKAHQKIYDVALSDGRKRDPKTGKAPPVGNSVNLAKATYTNSIGARELATLWSDPDFDPKTRAFYYARVIEIPTPRWTAFDAVRFGDKMAPEIPMILQERAYTSPIWYTP